MRCVRLLSGKAPIGGNIDPSLARACLSGLNLREFARDFGGEVALFAFDIDAHELIHQILAVQRVDLLHPVALSKQSANEREINLLQL